jgi:uncharacterized protein (DUF1499 family)
MLKENRGVMLSVVFVLVAFNSSCQREEPTTAGGLTNQMLLECPSSPNCVVSQYPKDEAHYLKPWTYTAAPKVFREKLDELLAETKNAEVIKSTSNYLLVTFKVPVVGFLDDVEFYLPENEKVVHYRSASRVGYSDLGVNKRRMESIRKALIRRGALNE